MFPDVKAPFSTAITVVIALVLSILTIVAAPQVQSAAGNFSTTPCSLTGTGTQSDPYVISNADDLWGVVYCDDDFVTKYFSVSANIDVRSATSAPTRSPIGDNRNGDCGINSVDFITPFTGVILGGGFSVTNIEIETTCGGGLFHSLGSVISGAMISNLTISGAISSSGALYTGAIAGKAESNSTISNLTVAIDIIADERVGGLVGLIDGSANLLIEDSKAQGAIEARGTGSFVGGFLGRSNTSTVTILRSSSTGIISSAPTVQAIGGFIGRAENSSINMQNSTRSSSISGGKEIGGIIGGVSLGTTTLSQITNLGNVSAIGKDWVGGAVGFSSATISLTDITNLGRIEGGSNSAGIVGIVNSGNASITQVSNAGPVSGSNNVGGLVGYSKGALKVGQSKNSGGVIGLANVGGIVGKADSAASVLIERSFTEATMTGTSAIGGLVGLADGNVAISNSYSVATLSGTSAIGGLIGSRPSSFKIETSFFGGNISGASDVDGLAAGNLSGTISSSYTITTSALVSSSTELELRTRSTYQNWNFDDVWSFGPCEINNQFPVLQWAEQIFFDLSCLQVQTPTQSSQAPVVSQPSVPVPSYDGPLVGNTPVEATLGAFAVLTGTKLQGVFRVEISGVVFNLISISATSLVFEIPQAFELGQFDLVLYSEFGKLTVIDGIRISSPPVVEADFGELLGYRWVARFDGNSRTLNPAQVSSIESGLGSFAPSTTVICWSYTTAETPKQWAIDHATQRAQAVCDLVQELKPEVKTFVRVRYGVEKSLAVRASLQFWRK